LLRTVNLKISHIRKLLNCDDHIGIKLDLLYDNVYQIVFIDFAILFPDAFENDIICDKFIDLKDELGIIDNIPQTIMYLPNLRHLSFDYEYIPPFIFDMIDLRSLFIGQKLCELSNDINKLTNLKKISINSVSLEILPILILPKLTHLSIQSSALYLNLSSLNLLTSLDLSNNKLTIFPSLNHLKYLTTLKLDTNHLEEFTDISLPLLIRLKLHDNQIKEFKNNNFPQLRHLKLTNNWLDKLDNNSLPNLSTLYLDNNGIVYLDLKNVPKLTHLDVSINEIVEIKNIPLGIKSIDAENNKITELFENGLQFKSLLRLNVSDNGISNIGEIDCPNLDDLDLSYNKLTKIPIIKNSKLKELNICNNNISGEIDIPITLVEFVAHNNMITKINNIKMCSFMRFLYLNHNNIQGGIDIPITIVDFIACNNMITEINNINNCTFIKTLKLDHNKLTKMPNITWSCHLSYLSISNNNISGNITIRGDITTIDLSCNNISIISFNHSTYCESPLKNLNLKNNLITFSKISRKDCEKVQFISCNGNYFDDKENSDSDSYSDSDKGW